MEKEQFEKDTRKFKELVSDNNYGEAISIALERAANAFKTGNQPQVDTYTSVARGLLVTAEAGFGASSFRQHSGTDKKCSFCGNDALNDLLVGAEAVICRKCTSAAQDYFNEADAT